MEDAAEDGLADDDGGQADDDGAAAHADVGKALVLAEQGARQGDQPVGDHQAQHHVEAGVDALGPAHVGVGAGGADGAAQLGAKEPVEDADQDQGDQDDHDHRVAEGKLLDPAQGDQQVVLIHVDGLVGLAHDLQVDRIEGQLGQDTGQDRRDAHEGVQQSGDKAAGQPRDKGQDQGGPDVLPGQQGHDADRAAGAEGVVHRQVGHIQDAVGQVDADSHDAPDQALCAGPRQRAGQVCQSC